MEAHPKDITRKYKLGIDPLPVNVNTSHDHFLAERDKIFRHAWLSIGRVEDVENAGDFFVQDLPMLDTSIIVVKGRDGKIRGFHNMCKHRGNKVVRTGIESGHCKGFSCGFHGWTYDLTGKLVIVPDEDQFFDVDKAQNGLTPVALETWEGFIFVSAEPKEPLKDFLGEVYDLFDGYFLGAVRTARYRAKVNANWKVILDAFVEAYHAPFLHGKAYPDALTGSNNPLCHLLGVNLWDRHRMYSVEGNEEHRSGPVEEVLMKNADSVFSAMASVTMDMDKLPKGINPTRSKNWAFDGYIIYPSFLFGPMRVMHMATYNFWPISEDCTIWQTDHYMGAPKDAGNRLALEFSKVFARDVQREDLITLENTQTMLKSGAMTEMLLSDQEVVVRHGYEVVEREIAR